MSCRTFGWGWVEGLFYINARIFVCCLQTSRDGRMIVTTLIKALGFIIKLKPNLQVWKSREKLLRVDLTSRWEWTSGGKKTLKRMNLKPQFCDPWTQRDTRRIHFPPPLNSQAVRVWAAAINHLHALKKKKFEQNVGTWFILIRFISFVLKLLSCQKCLSIFPLLFLSPNSVCSPLPLKPCVFSQQSPTQVRWPTGVTACAPRLRAWSKLMAIRKCRSHVRILINLIYLFSFQRAYLNVEFWHHQASP